MTPEGRPVSETVGVPVAPVTVMVQVALPPCCSVSPLPQEAEMLKPAVTVSATVVVETNVPEVPVIVIVPTPTVAVALAVSVSTLVLVVGLVAKVAVTPVGRPEAASVTEPANGLMSVTVMVIVQLVPCGREHEVTEGFSVKPPVEETTVIGKMTVAVVVPEVPVMVPE